MKIYVYDHGWSGADILVASDRETAIKKLIDPEIENEHKRAMDHDMLYDPQERHNPFWSHYHALVKNKENGSIQLQEYEIVDGLEFSTTGEG